MQSPFLEAFRAEWDAAPCDPSDLPAVPALSSRLDCRHLKVPPSPDYSDFVTLSHLTSALHCFSKRLGPVPMFKTMCIFFRNVSVE